jgi:hypothetical protein
VGCSSKRRAGREARAQFLEEPDLTQPAIFSLVKQPPHMYLPRGFAHGASDARERDARIPALPNHHGFDQRLIDL